MWQKYLLVIKVAAATTDNSGFLLLVTTLITIKIKLCPLTMRNFCLCVADCRLKTEDRSRGAYPKVLHFEARYPSVRRANLVQVLKKSVQVVESFDAFVQRVHHCASVFSKLETVGLLFFSFQFFEFLEHR